MPSIFLLRAVRSLASIFSRPDVYCVGILISSISDCPNNAVRYEICSIGLFVAFLKFSTLRYVIVDAMEFTWSRVLNSMLGFFVRCAGERAMFRIILV